MTAEELVTDDELRRLRHQLVELHRTTDEGLREEFDRSLPFGDGLFDRWARAERLGFGRGASIYDSALVFGDVEAGEQTWVGPHVLLDGSGGALRIGAYCSISAGVHVYTHDTVRWSLSLGALPRETAPVQIGDGCHIGAQSVVAAGVTIGDRCVVGANSFVKGTIPERSIVVGSPARVVGAVEGDGEEVRLVYGRES
jgi:carbonic anhydrase/acetyltransferase-like protein (isoleucine patch superfamily)